MSQRTSKLDCLKDYVLDLYLGQGLGAITVAARLAQSGLTVCEGTILNRLHYWGVVVRPQPATTTRTDLTPNDHELLAGLLLGDGSLSAIKPGINRNSCFSIATVHEEYASHLQQDLPFKTRVNIREKHTSIIQGHITKCRRAYRLSSNFDLALTDLHNHWYQNSTKIIPEDLQLTPTTVLHWFLGDGHAVYTHDHYVVVGFATYCFTWAECEGLVDRFKEVDSRLDFHVQQHRPGQPKIISQKQSTVGAFYEYVGTSPVNCFQYKWKQTRPKYAGYLNVESFRTDLERLRTEGLSCEALASWYQAQTGQPASGASLRLYLKRWANEKSHGETG